jgi:hypothetical protein
MNIVLLYFVLLNATVTATNVNAARPQRDLWRPERACLGTSRRFAALQKLGGCRRHS